MTKIVTCPRHFVAALPSLLVLVFLSVPGCGGGAPTTTTDDGTAAAPPTTDMATAAGGAPEGEDAEITAALAKLSPEDQAAARGQKVCPVGGGALGSMGTPIIVMAGERKVFLCCDGCKGEFEQEPDKYLAKLSGGESEAAPASAPEGASDGASETPSEEGTEIGNGNKGT